jgi:hypothetical protein
MKFTHRQMCGKSEREINLRIVELLLMVKFKSSTTSQKDSSFRVRVLRNKKIFSVWKLRFKWQVKKSKKWEIYCSMLSQFAQTRCHLLKMFMSQSPLSPLLKLQVRKNLFFDKFLIFLFLFSRQNTKYTQLNSFQSLKCTYCEAEEIKIIFWVVKNWILPKKK